MEKRKFEITGMTCSACVAHVERAVKKLGAEEVSVSLMTNGMTLCGDMPDAQLVEAVEKAGYGCRPAGRPGQQPVAKQASGQDAYQKEAAAAKKTVIVRGLSGGAHVRFYGAYVRLAPAGVFAGP